MNKKFQGALELLVVFLFGWVVAYLIFMSVIAELDRRDGIQVITKEQPYVMQSTE